MMSKKLLLIVATTMLLSVLSNSQQQDEDENGAARVSSLEEQPNEVPTKNAVVPQRKPKNETDNASDGETETTQERNERYVEAGLAVANVMAAIVGIASGPVGGVAAAGIAVIGYFLTELTKQKKTLWEQIERQVDARIADHVVEYHMSKTKADVFKVLERRFKKKEFTRADMDIVLDKRNLVFPHYFPSLKWCMELPLVMLYYLPFLITGYQTLAAKGEVDNCVLPNEMARYRAEVLTSMKEMMRKRYSQINGTGYDDPSVVYRRWGKRKMSRTEYRMTWSDGVGEGFTIRKWDDSDEWKGNDFQVEIDKIKKNTEDLLWKKIVEKINQFFDPKICFESFGCKCPKKIERSEIDFPFPRSCWASGIEGECMHPCGHFTYSYKWCWLKSKSDEYSDTCIIPSLNNCMPVTEEPIKFPNIFPVKKAKKGPPSEGGAKQAKDF